MAYKSRMNGLGLSASSKAGKTSVPMFDPDSLPKSKVPPLKPSNNPGPMTSPSSQGFNRPGTKQAHK